MVDNNMCRKAYKTLRPVKQHLFRIFVDEIILFFLAPQEMYSIKWCAVSKCQKKYVVVEHDLCIPIPNLLSCEFDLPCL